MALLPISEALERMLDGADMLSPETVKLVEASDRILAEPLFANRMQPPFNASAMDGYAVRAEDIATLPAFLKVVGVAQAGKRFNGTLNKGEAVRIFTGAPVPAEADTILLQEDAKAQDGSDMIEATEATAKGRHIRAAGLDFNQGDCLLAKGRNLDAAALSLAASANHPLLAVIRRPRIGIIATGDELVAPGDEPGIDQIIASNAYGIAALAKSAGADVHDYGIIPDNRDQLAAAFQRAFKEVDILVTLGGASVGDHDLVRSVLTQEGMELGFWKIAMRPGKPLMFGKVGETRILGLPGNPVASLVCTHLFVLPLIARLAGRKHRADMRKARLGAMMKDNDQRQDYVRAVVAYAEGIEGEELRVTPYELQDSSVLNTLANANALIIRPPFAPQSEIGQEVEILVLRDID